MKPPLDSSEKLKLFFSHRGLIFFLYFLAKSLIRGGLTARTLARILSVVGKKSAKDAP